MNESFACVVLAICLLLGPAGCASSKGASGDNTPSKGDSAAKEQDGGAVEVDENLLTVDVTLPAAYFEDSTEEEIQNGAKEEGYNSATVNPDGSVTYRMTKAKHREVLKTFKAEVDTMLDGLMNGEDATESFQEIAYNDQMSEFTGKVDKSLYSDWDAIANIAFYFAGMNYQAFSGVAPKDNHVVVKYVDMATGEVLNSGDSANIGKSSE